MDSNHTDPKDNRKKRKLYLENRKTKFTSTASNATCSSNIAAPSSSNRAHLTGYDFQPSYQDIPQLHPFFSDISYLNNSTMRNPLADITNQSVTNILCTDAKERRKIRKLYLDNRKSKLMSKSINPPSSGREDNNIPSVQSNVYRKSMLMSIPSTSNSRTPLSTISNYVSNNNNDDLRTSSIKRQYIQCGSNITFNKSSVLNRSSSCLKLSSGKHKIVRKTRNLSDIPLLDLTQDESNGVHIETTKGISEDYLDHGDQTYICEIYHAKLWKDEAFRGINRGNKTSYSLCCGYGKVELPELKAPPPLYEELFHGDDPKSKYFLKNIRRYNSMFAFTSMGGKVDSSINKGKAPYIFRLSGQNYHSMGSLLPPYGSRPKFSQLYIYDTENEVSNRQKAVGNKQNGVSASTTDPLDIQIIEYLKGMLDSKNVLVQSYRMVRQYFHANPQQDLKLRLIGRREKDGRTYNMPTTSEVAALIVGDIGDLLDRRDIIVETKSGSLRRICELHPSYLPLQYPLLFPHGEDGYYVDIPHRGVTPTSRSKCPNCTMREFFAYRIQDRVFYNKKEKKLEDSFSLILNSRRLLQQFLVDAYTMIESERLYFIRTQQKVLRCETYENLRLLQNHGKSDLSSAGQRVILPSSFTGGSRYMMQNYLDAMSLCRWYGYPDLFITVTCNPKWPEMTRLLKDTTLHLEDKPQILCRLFKIKLDSLIKDLKDTKLFGVVQAVVYTVEFQKRGLPHSHICLFLHSDYKLPTVEKIDPIISAEIPDKEEDPQLYSLVSEFMIHGPCGADNMNCPCMTKDNKCSKNFPKRFYDHTSIDSDGFPVYRRQNDGRFVEKSGTKLDNRNVVPYNKFLLKRYQAHINVEWCNQAGSIKYLFKYINKGPDRATVAVVDSTNNHQNDDAVDEVKEFLDCRYLSACEASWRIFGYDVHYRTPSVVRLPFHLKGQQNVCYGVDDDIENVLNKHSVASSMFLSWMDCNATYEQARELTYVEFPTKFVWKPDDRRWEPRKRGFAIGRIHHVSPSLGEAHFLRILLNKVKGPTCYEDIRTVNKHTYDTFRDACYALGLLDDDKEYIDAIEEASHSGSGYYIRSLFAMMLMSNSLSRPDFVWEQTWNYLCDGILYNQQMKLKSPGLSLTVDQIKNLTLFEIEKLLLGNNSSLKNFAMIPYPDHDSLATSNNRLVTEELNYDISMLQTEFYQFFERLTDEQRDIFDNVMTSVENNEGGVFFVYGYGGTGKTFIWKTLSAAIRSKGEIVINVASSGIASLLLTGGRTAHSRFRIPIDLHEDSLCSIKPDTDVAFLLKKTKLIIWDEAPMTHKHAFEALDRTLQDVLSSKKPFGGKVIVFGGDFRQILPVVTNGSRQDIVNASLSSSYLWQNCKVLTLTKNMRLTAGNEEGDLQQIKEFADWILDIGEGKVGDPNDGEAVIEIPDDLLIHDTVDPVGSLIEFVYTSLLDNIKNPEFFQERAILAPKHEAVQEINDRLLSMFPGEEKEYLSSDSLCQTEDLGENNEGLYSPEILNGLKLPGLPNHRLVLKVGVPVMLLRNIDPQKGLCNGTRLQVISIGKRLIEVAVMSGTNIGERRLIPRMCLNPSDKKIPFKIQRRQFPLAVCFAMTINKSQGQSLSRVGLFLKDPVFTHGQLYVALSRVKSREGLKILILDKDGQVTNKTSNVVYKEIFSNL